MMEKIDIKGLVPCYNVYRQHGGSLDAQDYDRVSYKTMKYIGYITLDRAYKYINEDDDILWCHAALCDQYVAIDNLRERVNAAKDITSETVGPHSVHYYSAVEALERAKIDVYNIAKLWLSRYMYRGVPYV